MTRKLSNIVLWYDAYLEYVSRVGKNLTKLERGYMMNIHQNGLESFFQEYDLSHIIQRVLNDLLTYPELWDYFGYTEEEKTILINTISFDMSNENYQRVFDKIVEENNEIIDSKSNNNENDDELKNNIVSELTSSVYGYTINQINKFIDKFIDLDRTKIIKMLIDNDSHGVYSDEDNIDEYGRIATKEELLINLINIEIQNSDDDENEEDIDEEKIEEPDFRRGQKVTNGTGLKAIVKAINWDYSVLEVSVYYDNGSVNEYEDEWDFSETEILTEEYSDEVEDDYDSMTDEEILENYEHFVNWAQMQLDGSDNNIDWSSITEDKYNKLLQSVYSLNQGIECTEMLDILIIINNG